MDTGVEGEFSFSDFSPHALTFIPDLNCILASDRNGKTGTIDVVTGRVQQCPDIAVPPSHPSPVLVGLHDPSNRVVVATSDVLGSRTVHKGCVLLNTILQAPTSKKEERVTLEIPAKQASSLVKELQKSAPRSYASLVKDITVLLLAQADLCRGTKYSTVTFAGTVGKLTEIFTEILAKLKASTAQTSRTTLVSSTPVPTLLPLVASLAFRLYLLHPEHCPKISKLVTGELGISMTESKLMNVEGLRRLSLSEWPHDYEWAVPQTMAEAGFYHLAGPQGNSVSKGDRVTCFSCRVYLYSWDPTDEPWSEHERHAIQCPYIRGEYTDNVPLEETQASCPAHRCSLRREGQQGAGPGAQDRIVVLGTSMGTELVAVGTEWGRVVLLDMGGGLLITERASLQLTSDVLLKWLERRIDSAPLFSHIVSAAPLFPPAPPQAHSCPELPQTTSIPLSDITSLLPPSSSTSLLPQVANTPVSPATGYLHLHPQVDDSTPSSAPEGGAGVDNEQGGNADSSHPVEGDGDEVNGDSNSRSDPLVQEGEVNGAEMEQNAVVSASSADSNTQESSTAVLSTAESTTVTEEPSSLHSGTGELTTSSSSSDVPKSKHSFHITALSVFTRGGGSVSECPKSSSTPSTSSASVKSSSDGPSTFLVTGLTSVHPSTQNLTPMLLVHHVKTKSRCSSKTKAPAFASSVASFAQNPAAFLDIADPLTNPIPLSMSSREDLASLEVVDGIPLTECACGTESGCMPEVGQIVPMQGGAMLAVTCSTAGSSTSNSRCSVLLLFKVSLAGKLEAECVSSVLMSSSECYICPAPATTAATSCPQQQSDRSLLACVGSDGEACLYSCAEGRLEKLAETHCGASAMQEGDRVTSCAYCPTTARLFVSLESGKVLSLKFEEHREPTPKPSTDTLKTLDPKDLDNVLSLITVSPLGVPFTCSSSVHWKEISLLWYNRRSPQHMNVAPLMPDRPRGPQHALPHRRGNVDNCRILQYEPTLEQTTGRFSFELVMDGPEVVPVGCVSVRLTFANTQCISDDASISLALPSATPAGVNTPGLDWQLCGPVRLKPLADVTEQALQVFLSHPALLTSQSRTLVLSIDHLFSSDYKEVSFVESAGGGLDAYSRRQCWRTRAAYRYQPQAGSSQAENKVTIPVQASLTINIHPLAASIDTLLQSPITFPTLSTSIHDPAFILNITLMACGGRVERNELQNLPEPLQDQVRGGAIATGREVQQKALDVLMWVGLVHCGATAESGGYALMVSAVGQLLVSLMSACFVRGERLLSHKASQLLSMLYRFECDNDVIHQFRLMLSEALLCLLPLLPLFTSSACVHWFLRLLATLTGPADAPSISRICHRLLVNLSRVLSTKDSLPAQILQTNFRHEASVFEPELFDIYLSYCQKSTSVITKPKSSTTTSTTTTTTTLPPTTTATSAQQAFNSASFGSIPSAYLYASSVDLNAYADSLPPTGLQYYVTPPTSVPAVSVDKSLFGGYPKKIVVPGISGTIPAGTTHIVTDRGGHTIYDSELKLLLDSKKTEAQCKKFVEDFTTYKHGSFLLYSQRGLLETLPLTYTCLSVTGNATVLEPNIHTLPQAAEHQPTQTQVSFISKTTTGYSYPTGLVESEQQKREFATPYNKHSGSGTHPIPQILTDISIMPKELMMQIESLKSGVAYSALLKFSQPVALTDISIPATGTMSSVSVDVWLEPDGESGCVRVGQSSEIKTRSLMLGNLTPPPVCQYAKVTFLGSLTNTREMAQVFIGAFYGLPLFPPDQTPSTEQLHSLEERLLTQYYLHRDSLSSALLSYASLHAGTPNLQQYEEKVSVEYQQCFKMQVSLARLRNFMKRLSESENADSGKSGEFCLPQESGINYAQYSVSKLSKMVGCLVDTLLTLNIDPSSTRQSRQDSFTPAELSDESVNAETADEGLVLIDEGSTPQAHVLTEEECRVLFYTLCIHGIPKMHARAIALLIKYCGSQRWWGGFIVSVAANLFGEHQVDIFNKERALLQLSAMAQHTYSSSDLLPSILTFLRDKLSQFLQPPRDPAATPTNISDHAVLQWIVMLLCHFLSSVVSSDPQCNLFVPLPTIPPVGKFTKVLESQMDEASKAKEKEESKDTLMEMHKEVKKMLGYVQTVVESAASKDAYKLAVKKQLESKLKEYKSLRRKLTQCEQATAPSTSSSAGELSPPTGEQPEKADPALSSLPQELCHTVVKGLVKYILTLCQLDCDMDFIPVLSKCVSLLVSATKWSYPLHTLVSEQELPQLLAYSTASTLPAPHHPLPTLAPSLEWRRRTLQNLFMSVLYHGEVRPCLEVTKVNSRTHTRACQTVKVRRVKFRSSSVNRLVTKRKTEAAPEKKSVKGSSVHYSTFVISNSIESRRVYMSDTIPELQLQKVAKAVYGSILLSLLNARPLTPSVVEVGDKSTTDAYLERLGPSHCACVFPETVAMLVGAVEQLLLSTTGQRQSSLTDVDLLMVLSLWQELNEVLVSPYTQNTEQHELDEPLLVNSEHCCVILIDYLLEQPSVSPTIWQASLANILSGIQRRKDLFVDYDKLLAVIVKFLVSSTAAAASGLVSRIVGALLGEERKLVSGCVRGKLSGACLLLDVLITALGKRNMLHQDYSLLHELAKTLADTQNDYIPEPDYAASSHIYHLIHQLCHLLTDLLPQALGENTFPGVELFGSELDDTSRRKHYTALNDLHKRTWVPTSTEMVGLARLVSQLLQLLLKVFSDKCGLSPPTTSYLSLELYCREQFAGRSSDEEDNSNRDYLMLAHPQVQSLSLVYADSELLFKFLQLLNVLTAHRNRSMSKELALYEEFILFLYNHCQDHSCFFQPIQRVLDASPENGHLSKLFISLITRAPTRAFRGRSKPHDTAEFIRCGGGAMVLRNLIGSAKQKAHGGSGWGASGIGKGVGVHAINKLGQRDTPQKTISDTSNLVDFYPQCFSYLSSNKKVTKVNQSVQNYSLFQHTYPAGESCVQLHIVSPHPVLLHNFICCLIPLETGSTSHGSPSKIAIECSVHGGRQSFVPVTPVFVTDSLKILNVAFHQPVLTQHTVVRFHHPLLSNTVVVSKVEYLGTSFGGHAHTITPRTELTVPAYKEEEHQGAGWMDIVDQWLHSSEEAALALKSLFVQLPALLPSCLSMLSTRHHIGQKFAGQLENLLIAIADQCPDHAMTILHHLLGFPAATGPGSGLPELTQDRDAAGSSSFSFCLLSKLCEPTSDVSRQRLAVSVRLLSNLPPGAPPPTRHTPSLVCALSHMIWHGRDIEDICHEDTFRSLVELAFSLELGSHYKTAMNALLCALCRTSPSHFSLLLASCEDVLISEPGTVGQRLNTLAGAAQSFHCTEVLLGSELVAKMVSRLTNGFEKLLDLAYNTSPMGSETPPTTADGNLRGLVSSLSSLLAFFADYFRHWRRGKEWMARTDNHRFWAPMIQFLCMDTTVISALEASFVQEVAFNFFSVCLFGCEASKKVFVQLVCDLLRNQCYTAAGGGDDTRNVKTPVLTPFLHKLLVGLVFQHENVPVIVKLVPPPLDQVKVGCVTGPLSLPSTCEVSDFHPSHPIGETCYYLRAPGAFTLTQLEALVRSHDTVKPAPVKAEAKKTEKSTHRKSVASAKTLAAKVAVLRHPASAATAPASDIDSLSVANFTLKDWKPGKEESEKTEQKGLPSFTTLAYYTLDCDNTLAEEECSVYSSLLTSYAKLDDEERSARAENELLCDLVPTCSADHPLLVVLDQKGLYFGARHSSSSASPPLSEMFSMLVSYEGLLPLARSVPPLYPYLWPSSLLGDDASGTSLESDPVVGSRQLFKPYSLLGPPIVAPFRSMVMFGQCLQLEAFGRVLCENLSAAYMLMRLLLGEDLRDATPTTTKPISESLSYLPYLIALETLRKNPAGSPEGRVLRVRAREVGVLQLVLQCLSLASHHSPRVEGEAVGNISLESGATPTPKKVASSLDKQYWAKGTGFGTGSTSSSYNMVAVRAKHKSEEKYVCVCFAILSEYLSCRGGGRKGEEGGGEEGEEGVFVTPGGGGGEDYCTVEVIELLCRSCLLPALASYLLNDSVLDICKHVELYQTVLHLVSSLAGNPATQHLLTLPVFSSAGTQSSSAGVTSLASLIAKLRDIAVIYQKTAKLKERRPSPRTSAAARALPKRTATDVAAVTAATALLGKPQPAPSVIKPPANSLSVDMSPPDPISPPEQLTQEEVDLLISDASTDEYEDLSNSVPPPVKPIISLSPTDDESSELGKVAESGEVGLVASLETEDALTAQLSTVCEQLKETEGEVTTEDSSLLSLTNFLEEKEGGGVGGGGSAPEDSSVTVQKEGKGEESMADLPVEKEADSMANTVEEREGVVTKSKADNATEKEGNMKVTGEKEGVRSESPATKEEGKEGESTAEGRDDTAVTEEREAGDRESEIKRVAETMARDIILVSVGQLQREEAPSLTADEGSEHSPPRENGTKTEGAGKLEASGIEEINKPVDTKAPPLPPPPPPIPKPDTTAAIPPLPPRIIKRVLLSRRTDRTTKAMAAAKLTSSDEADLVELVNNILSVSEEVGGVVRTLKREAGQYSRQTSTSTPLTETPQEAAFAYVKAMKPLQFDTYCFTTEDEMGKTGFTCPFHYQAQVEGATAASQDPSRARRLAQEISTLSTSLPISPSSTVFVRCDEERLDVMKVLITGPSDTPYANGCFEFDVFFPHDYPKSPMLVNLKTTGHGRVRFNPNLYNDGKVCLSVLNTWHGRPEEKWNSSSSLLQVLVSIQSLILVPEPYFNEPGYEQSRGTPYGDQKSIAYSSNISVATMQWAMINQIRNPTPCFKQVILQHFLLRKDSIQTQYEAWRCELEEAIKKAKVGDTTVHLLREHLHSLNKSMETLRVELDKLKIEDIQTATEGGTEEQ